MLTISRWRTLDVSVIHYAVYIGKGNINNVPYNFTGHTFRAQVREKTAVKGKEKKIILDLPVISAVPTNGVLRILVGRDVTSALKNFGPDELEWDLIALDPAGKDLDIITTEAAEIVTPATNPDSANFPNPSLPVGAIGAGITFIDVVDQAWLVIVKDGQIYHTPVAFGAPPP